MVLNFIRYGITIKNSTKVNIIFPGNHKFANIGYYWDDKTIGKIRDLLHEFQDMFPTKCLEMKGVVEDLGEIFIYHLILIQDL